MKIFMSVLLVSLGLALSAAAPNGWIIAGSAPSNYEFGVDVNSSDGQKAAFIRAKPQQVAPAGFGTLMQTVAANDYRGGRWKLSARMRTVDANKAQLWMRVDGPDGKVKAFDNMNDRAVMGTSEWKRYEIVLDVADDSIAVAFGFFLVGGAGEVWADDFKFERVTLATPVTSTGGPTLPRAPTNLNFEQ